MARPLRIEYPGAWYHVMNRGRRGEDIFEEKEDYLLFIDLLQDAVDMWGVNISAFCLMGNHYHLLIQTPRGNLSRIMRHVNGIYTQLFNNRHGLDGQLFRGRYKAILVEGDVYVLQLLRYIHKNPVNAGIVEKAEKYLWSSHAGYLTNSKKWKWLYKDFILNQLCKNSSNPRKAYREFISQPDSDEITKLFGQKKLPSLFGSVKFVEWVKDGFFKVGYSKEIPDSKELAPSKEKILSLVEKEYKLNGDEIRGIKRGARREGRDVAVYLSRQLAGESLDKIGTFLKISNYSTVSNILGRVKKRMASDKKYLKRVRRLEGFAKLSQKQT